MKILFLPNGLGLAHVGRCAVIAKELQKRGNEVFFAIGKHGSIVLKMEGLPFSLIPEIPIGNLKNFARLNPSLISAQMMERFVQKELLLFKTWKPDVVIADTRPSAKISTLVSQIPLITLVNVDATPLYDFEKARIEFPYYWSRILPDFIESILKKQSSQKVLAKLAPFFLRAISARELLNYNLVLVKYGQKPLSNIFKFLTGDLTLILDIPQFRPIRNVKDNVKVVGPVFWEGVKKLPRWQNKLKNKTTIYVTASGTGDKKILQKIINYLSAAPHQVITTVGNTCKVNDIKLPSRDDFFITNFLSGNWIMKKAELIIFPAGSATAYQALSYGVPQIGIPINIDQQDSVNQLVRLETAISINPYRELSKEKLLSSIDIILNNQKYRKNAQKMQQIISRYHAVRESVNFIEGFSH